MNPDILSTYTKKLCHPLKEIRERALLLLVAKLKLGWQLDDELSGTRELIEYLLAWFHVQKPTLQYEAFYLLLSIIKTETGAYIAKEYGINELIKTISNIKHKIDGSAKDVYENLLDTLQFLDTVQSQENITIPKLKLTSGSSQCESGPTSGYYDVGNAFATSEEGSLFKEDLNVIQDSSTKNEDPDTIKLLLFPWVELSSSDLNILLNIENALKLLKSSRKCCRFIRDVFLRDFPPEIFLNRPLSIQCLINIVSGVQSGNMTEALNVLLCITQALCTRLRQLACIELIHEQRKKQVQVCEQSDNYPDVGLVDNEDQQSVSSSNAVDRDGLDALRQLPAPIYALDTAQLIISVMTKSVVLGDDEEKHEVLSMSELNTCVCIVEYLVQLLLDCVSDKFWSTEHTTRTHKEIAHKSCAVMRSLGELLDKYSKSLKESVTRRHVRVAWLRLVSSSERVVHWSRRSPLPPATVVAALQAAQLDPALELYYPRLLERINYTIDNCSFPIDREYKRKYAELRKIFSAIDVTVQFIKNKNSCQDSKNVLTIIKDSLPALEIHLNEGYIKDIGEILLRKLKTWKMEDKDWSLARSIALHLMACNSEWVQGKFYKMMVETIKLVMVTNESNAEDEKSLYLLFDVGILTEICCHGICSKYKEVQSPASEMMIYLLRGRMVLSEAAWWSLLASLLPVLPLLHVYAAHDTTLGQAISKSLDLEIATRMGVPEAEVFMGLVRLLFVRCSAVQLEAAMSICFMLEDDKYLPPKDSLRPDVLLTALKSVQPQDFNVQFTSSPTKSNQKTTVIQILEVLKQDLMLDENGYLSGCRDTLSPTLDPTLRRATLQQLSVVVQYHDTHDTFVEYDGVHVVVAILRLSLLVDDYLAFPECALNCVSILNSVSYGCRYALSKIHDLPALLIRVVVSFPSSASGVLWSGQVLCVCAWAGFALLDLGPDRTRVLALPAHVTAHTSLPLFAQPYWTVSPNAEHSTLEWVTSGAEWREAVCVRWWSVDCVPPRPPYRLPRSFGGSASLPPLPCLSSLPSHAAQHYLTQLQNATHHTHVYHALVHLDAYVHLVPMCSSPLSSWSSLPWHSALGRYLSAPPASARDVTLLTTLLRFIITYMDNVPNKDGTMTWIMESFLNSDTSMICLLGRDHFYPQQTQQDTIEVIQLQIHIVKILLRCIILIDKLSEYDTNKLDSFVKIIVACIEKVNLKDFHSLGYLNELVRCLRYTVTCRHWRGEEAAVAGRGAGRGASRGSGARGGGSTRDALLTLTALLDLMHLNRVPVERWMEWFNVEVVTGLVRGCSAPGAELRAVSLRLLAGLAHYAQFLPHIAQELDEESLSYFAASRFCDKSEANVVRAAAAALLTAVTSRLSVHSDELKIEVLDSLNSTEFADVCIDTLVEFCNEDEYNLYLEPNLPMSVLERRGELEVRSRKCGDVRVTPAYVCLNKRAPPTPSLVVALADVLYNLAPYNQLPVQSWNEKGLFRLLFKCLSCSSLDLETRTKVHIAACRALGRYVDVHKCVRTTLANTKDCLHNLLATITPLQPDERQSWTVNARAQALLVLGSLVVDRGASVSVWEDLKNKYAPSFFHLILQTLEIDNEEIRTAGVYCLSQLIQTLLSKKRDRTLDEDYLNILEDLKSPYIDSPRTQSVGDGDHDHCQPEYLVQDICKRLIALYYQDAVFSNDLAKIAAETDDSWCCVWSCLCSLVTVSGRSREYCLHRSVPVSLVAALNHIRDHLTLTGKPAHVIRNADHNPVLLKLQWLLLTMSCMMTNYLAAKNAFVDSGLAITLNRLWPWCVITEQLRTTVLNLLLVYNNDCPKAWSSMCVCVMGRCLATEVAAVVTRAAHAPHAPRPPHTNTLLTALTLLAHLVLHHHARTLILKSEALSSVYVCGVRGAGAEGVWAVAGRVAERAARGAEGAGAVWAALGPLLHLPRVHRAALPALLPALAHIAHHHRASALQHSGLLELLCSTLLSGDPPEVLSAARAVWALAANNYRAKLVLRSAGIAAAVKSSIEHLQRLRRDATAELALQILTYTNTILHTS